MHRPTTGLFCRLALTLIAGLAAWARNPSPASAADFGAGPSLSATSGAGGLFDPADALTSVPVDGNSVSLTSYLDESSPTEVLASQEKAACVDPASCDCGSGCWRWQLLPAGLIYRSYWAGVKEPRIAAQWVYEREQGWFYDVELGGRAGVVRCGTDDPLRPEGWQLDFEGAVFPRVESEILDLRSTDFRYGLPLSYGRGPYQMKLAFYHLSSHLGDEFLLKNPSVPRINYVRDALAWGHSLYWTENLRLYGEAAWAYRTDGGAEPWEFQFGIDYARGTPTGLRPVPFLAINGHLRQEVDFGGNLVVQTGCLWRGVSGQVLRLGLHYFAGKSDQFEFFNQNEDKIGLGIWYDF